MTKTCTLTILDEINVHFTGLDPKILKTLENKYKWTTPDARFQPAVRLGRIDGYTRLFNKGLFYLNLIDEEFITTLTECGYELEVVDKRFPYDRVIPTVDEFLYKHVIFKGEQLTLREVQVNSINAALTNQCGIFELATGAGKCLGAGTPVLLYDGTIRPVETIESGDILMGPDSAPRVVTSICQGREMLYRVVPVKGDPYVVNESHILSLKKTGVRAPGAKGEVVNIPVTEWLSQTNTFRHQHKGWRAAVNFAVNTVPLPVDPYFLGLWLGDGSSASAAITTGDVEVSEYVKQYATELGLVIRAEEGTGCQTLHLTHGGKSGFQVKQRLTNKLRDLGVINNKHVPHLYATSLHSERMQLLAGYIDADGSYDGRGYDIISKSELLMDGIVFVARSLGFSAYKSKCHKTCSNNGVSGEYFRAYISGNIDSIPVKVSRKRAEQRRQRKDPLVTGITVEPIGVGEYYGFTISGNDRLFLLGDFTVTHNTATCGAIADLHRPYGRTMIIVPSVDLASQTLKMFKAMGIEDCGEFHSGTKGVETIIVGTWQSLIRYPESIEGVVCLIADECHEYNAKEILQFLTTTCRNVPFRYGFTGTIPKETLSQKQLEAALGKVLYRKVAHELQAEGILAECFIDVLQTVEDPSAEFAYHDEEKNYLLNNPARRMYLRDTIDRIRQSGNTIVIIDTIELGSWLEQNIPNCVFISGPMPSKRRMMNYDRMAVEDNAVFVCTRGVIKRGIDIARVFNLIYIEIGKKYEGVIQSVGRGLRTSADKTKVNIFDICATTKYSKRHLTERKKFYTEAKYPFKVTKVSY